MSQRFYFVLFSLSARPAAMQAHIIIMPNADPAIKLTVAAITVISSVRIFKRFICRTGFPVVAMQIRAKRVPVVQQKCVLPGLAGRA